MAEVKDIPLSKLQSNTGQIEGLPKNPRLIKDDKYKKLVQSIQDDPEMLALRELIVVPQNGHFVVIAGNMRLKAMQELKYKAAPCKVLPKQTPVEKLKAYTIKDNIGYGEHEWETLANEWDLDQLTNWGLDIPDFVNKQEVTEDDYEIPDEIETDIVLGDLFEIGQHRLLCGDSTNADDVARLMNGQKADMVFTDPPYGMFLETDFSKIKGSEKSIGFKGKLLGNSYEKIKGDNEDFKPELITTIFDNFNYCKEIFVFGADYFIDLLPNYGKDGCLLVWNKRSSEEQQKGIGNCFELFWSKQKHKKYVFNFEWFGFLSKDDPQDARNRLHPSMKPIKLIAQIFQWFKLSGKIVVDLYSGSGSTMVAMHKLNRICYTMDLDPKWCWVTIDRMLKLDSSIEIKKNGEPYKQNIAA